MAGIQEYVKYLKQLRELLPKLRAGEISAIEFGDGNEMGFMSHHRVQYIQTPGGKQLCFKLVSRGMLGSGNYIGDPDNRTIEMHAQKLIMEYTKPTPFKEKLQEIYAKRAAEGKPEHKAPELRYFAVE